MQNKYENYVDKTKCLEEGIRRFPSVYIEGNAATGKSTMVQMLLEKYPGQEVCSFDLSKQLPEHDRLLEQLVLLKKQMEDKTLWVVIENIPKDLEEQLEDTLVTMVESMTGESRMIFTSREKPAMKMLSLLWKGQMEMLQMEKLLFTVEEVRELAQKMEVSLDANMLYEKTGGWSGCVSVLLRLAKTNQSLASKEMEELLDSYEMRAYIHEKIILPLSEEERKILAHGAGCPWMNEELCSSVWEAENAAELLENLSRKGFLIYDAEKRYWSIAPLFVNYISPITPVPGKEDVWYEKKGKIAEMLQCLKRIGNREAYREAVLRYYDRIYGMGLLDEDALDWGSEEPIDCYLRGVYDYAHQEMEGLKKEIASLQRRKEKDFQVREIILNLAYLNPEMTLSEWLELLEESTKDRKKIRLYHMLGNSVTYLCGLRDLTELFACDKKEENRKAQLWQQAFGEPEWKGYRLAKIDYYMETERKDQLTEEDWNFLRDQGEKQELWQFRMAKLYLLCKLQRMQPEEDRIKRIRALEKSLRKENHSSCPEMAEAISSLYSPWYGAREKMSRWLRYNVLDNTKAIEEDNFLMFYCRAKGYILLNQYERAEKILKKLVPYVQNYQRHRFTAELLFQYAIVNWGKNLKGQAVRNAIESFLISQKSRYVSFYAGYGHKGRQVLDAFIEWQQVNAPENWSRKKKYNYGNVLTMPIEDYMQVIVRTTKKAARIGNKFPEEYIEEHLTMMETIILQDIGRGMSNAQICEELGLKLPTVKGHIYSLFKKLDVKSRTQAVVKGKTMGILQ